MLQLFLQSLAAGAVITALSYGLRTLARQRAARRPALAPGQALACIKPLDIPEH